MTNAPDIFDRDASGYDDARRRLIPPFDDFYGVAVSAVALAGPVRRVLDLGAGTGLLSRRVRDVFPEAEVTLLDGAGAMLARARESLGDEGFRYRKADLDETLPEGPWDAVVSALAIHHLDDPGKRQLLARVAGTLRPGGVFVNAEQVDGPTDAMSALYARWHEARARAAGSDDAEWQAAVERMTYDQRVDVGTQLTWMREAGLTDVDCLYKHHRFAVLVGRR